MEWIKRSIYDFSKEEYEECLELMTPDRRAHIETIAHDTTRICSVLGEWMAKNTLSEYTEMPLDSITLLRTEKGKPFVKDTALNFSIAHSGEWVVLAVDERPVGIDIEVERSVDLKITNRVCTASDMDFLTQSGALSNDKNCEELIHRFFRIWTAKEAYFKMLGTGIGDLKSISYCDLKPKHFYEDNCVITIITE